MTCHPKCIRLPFFSWAKIKTRLLVNAVMLSTWKTKLSLIHLRWDNHEHIFLIYWGLTINEIFLDEFHTNLIIAAKVLARCKKQGKHVIVLNMKTIKSSNKSQKKHSKLQIYVNLVKYATFIHYKIESFWDACRDV